MLAVDTNSCLDDAVKKRVPSYVGMHVRYFVFTSQRVHIPPADLTKEIGSLNGEGSSLDTSFFLVG